MSWFLSFSREYIDPTDPLPEHVFLADIAHALSMLCRFGGHSDRFYSVAQHSVMVCDNAPKNLKLAALFHDASEAYLGDVISPLKIHLPRYKNLQHEWEIAIEEHFDIHLTQEHRKELKDLDRRALVTERNLLFAVAKRDWSVDKDGVAPFELKGDFLCWTPKQAEGIFLDRYYDITDDF